MRTIKQLFDQPKATYLLSFVHLWSQFSHYGMRALLVLFMLNVLQFPTARALGIYAVFCSLVELGGVFGAVFAEKFIGLRRSILLGGWIIALGHFSLAMHWFFFGLALLIVGSSLFSTNLTALMGFFYAPNDSRRTNGFTLFYISINIGAFFATLLCGFLAKTYGWEYGFGVAAGGMILGNIVLFSYRHLLEGKGERPRVRSTLGAFVLLIGLGIALIALLGQHFALPLLPFLAVVVGAVLFNRLRQKNQVFLTLGIPLLALTLFYSAEEQIGSSLLIFTEMFATHTFFGFTIPSSVILSINPIVIILMGVVASALFLRIQSSFSRLFIPFILSAGAFFILIFARQVQIGTIMGVVAVISFAELLIGPIVYSACSRVATEHNDPKIMGLVPIAFSLAALFGGLLSKGIAKSGFHFGFGCLGIVLTFLGLVLGIAAREGERVMPPVVE